MAYWLGTLRSVFLRLLIACIGGGGLGLLAKFADFSSLGYAETAFAVFFWVAALMVPTFKGHVDRATFWLLLMEASLALYQVSIYNVVFDDYIFFRLGPAILSGLLFVFTCGERGQKSTFLYIAWITCNLPALIPSIFEGYMNVNKAMVIWSFNSLYPLVFYYAFDVMKRTSFPQQLLGEFISIAVLVMCFIPLLLIPVELTLRETSSFASLQFGGRAYSVFGAVILSFPVLLITLLRWPIFLRFMSIGLIFMLVATSFSRGVIFIIILLGFGVVIFSNKQWRRLVKGFIVTALFLIFIGWLIKPEIIFDAGWFWLLRLNLSSNFSAGISLDTAAFIDAERLSIWEMASSLFADSPLWGHGIGTTPYLIRTATANQFSFSGMHNLALTVLVERGLIGFVGLFWLLFRIGYLIYFNKQLPFPRLLMAYSFILFLVFAHGTGVELFLNSTRSVNVTITVYLFLMIGYLEYQPDMARKDSSVAILSAKDNSMEGA